MDNNQAINDLLALMARLRDPAIERADMADLKDELGDLLLQVVFHAQMAKEKGLFTFDDVARHVTGKMIHRHPHVFGDEKAAGAQDVEGRIWEERKAQEGKKQALESALDDVPRNLPALIRAQKLQKRAARVGFEWNAAIDVLDKLEEETHEMREALAGGRREEVIDELGDLFFVLTNFGRMLGVNCEETLRHANTKFERRFKGMESEIKQKGLKMEDVSLEEMEAGWQAQKLKEKKSAA